MRTVYPTGTTLYRPDSCFNGYTLLWREKTVDLVDMNGRKVHSWEIEPHDIGLDEGGLPRVKLLPNGHVMALFGGLGRVMGGVAEYDWDNTLVWHYNPEAGVAHHDFHVKADGNVLLICREAVPAEIMRRVTDPQRRQHSLFSDVILEVSREREVIWDWHLHDHLDINQCNSIPASRDWPFGPDNNTITDWTHTNTVQALPENKWHDQGDKRFSPGNVLISMRQLDTILVADRETGQIAWSYTGDYKGGMSGQHESCMIEKGTPGEGNILIFDNGASPTKDLAHAGCSFVLEIEPPAKQVVWVYQNREQFHSNYTSSCQRLANGNTLICEAAGRRVFEVTPEGTIVWEYVPGGTRSYRYPYDYCPQMSHLDQPKEIPVEPPGDFRIKPSTQ